MLEAHIEAIRRRMQTVYHAPTGVYTIGDQTLHTDEHVLCRGEETAYLSPTEFELLLYFINNEGTLLEFEQIYQYVWQKPSYGDLRTLFSHVRNLRKKIEETIIEFDNHSIHTTVTIGMAIKKSGQTVELWIQEADNKLYTGKNNGRNRVIE
jgi:DNA-binding response OmpR family regulator